MHTFAMLRTPGFVVLEFNFSYNFVFQPYEIGSYLASECIKLILSLPYLYLLVFRFNYYS